MQSNNESSWSGSNLVPIVTVMARNGTTFGIKVSGLGDDWFTGEANMIKGLYFPVMAGGWHSSIWRQCHYRDCRYRSIRSGRFSCNIGTHRWIC